MKSIITFVLSLMFLTAGHYSFGQISLAHHLKNTKFTNVLSTGFRFTFDWDTTYAPDEFWFTYDTTDLFLRPADVDVSRSIPGFNKDHALNWDHKVNPGTYSVVIPFGGGRIVPPYIDKTIFWRLTIIDVQIQCFEFSKLDSFKTSNKYIEVKNFAAGSNGALLTIRLHGSKNPNGKVKVCEIDYDLGFPRETKVFEANFQFNADSVFSEVAVKAPRENSWYYVYATVIDGDTITSENDYSIPELIITKFCRHVTYSLLSSSVRSGDMLNIKYAFTYPPEALGSWIIFETKTENNGTATTLSQQEYILHGSGNGAYLQEIVNFSVPIKNPNFKFTIQMIDPCGLGTIKEFTSSSTGIKSFSKTEINVYPNPFTNELFINTENKNESVNVVDALGKDVFSGMVSVPINTSEWSPGIYFIQFQSGRVQKIIKQ